MVKKPNPSHKRRPLKTYSKPFNLLRPGTGIRFTPPEMWGRPAGQSYRARLLLLAILLGGSISVYLNLPAPAPKAAPPPPPAPRIMREEKVTANSAAAVNIPVQAAETSAAAQPPAPETAARNCIRFGIFLSRENAERQAQTLAKKGISIAVETVIRPVNAFSLKAGPAEGAAAWNNLKSAAAKLNVAPVEEVDGKYVLVGPIWLKDRALAAENAIKAAGFKTEIAQESKEREMFKVLSAPYESAEAAKRSLGEMQTNGIEGVLDE